MLKKEARCQLKEKNKGCFTGKDYKEASQVIAQVRYSIANDITEAITIMRFRSSRSHILLKIYVLKNFANFLGK